MACELGRRDELVGCTSFCVKPTGLARTAQIVGGTKDPDLDKIAALKPTHILVNEEENKPEHIRACQALAPTFVSFPKGPGEVPRLLREAGKWLGVSEAGEKAAAEVEHAATELAEARAGSGEARRFLYLIWREPYMLASSDSYISAMLAAAGLVNAAPALGDNRYPSVTVAEMRTARSDVLLLSSEPYPFRNRDAARLRGEWPEAPPMLWIDGQQLSWYGTLTAEGLEALTRWVRGDGAGLVREL